VFYAEQVGIPAIPIGVAEVRVRKGAPAPRNDECGSREASVARMKRSAIRGCRVRWSAGPGLRKRSIRATPPRMSIFFPIRYW